MTQDKADNRSRDIKRTAGKIGKGIANIGKNSLYFTLGLGVEAVRTTNKAVKKLCSMTKSASRRGLDNERLWYSMGGYDSYDDDGRSYCRSVIDKARSLEIEVGYRQMQGVVDIFAYCSKDEVDSLAEALNIDPALFEAEVGKYSVRLIQKGSPFYE